MNTSKPEPPDIKAKEPEAAAAAPSNFVREIVLEDLKTNKWDGRVHTRFPHTVFGIKS